MKSSVSRKEETRGRIVAVAASLFLKKGVDRVGVDEVMRECGLTHGAFYGHFASKEVLIREACAAAFSEAVGDWPDFARKLSNDVAWEDFSKDYFAGDLISPKNPACTSAILGADIARRQDATSANHAALVRTVIDLLVVETGSARSNAILIVAALTGATLLAAQVSQDKPLAEEIFNTTRKKLSDVGVTPQKQELRGVRSRTLGIDGSGCSGSPRGSAG